MTLAQTSCTILGALVLQLPACNGLALLLFRLYCFNLITRSILKVCLCPTPLTSDDNGAEVCWPILGSAVKCATSVSLLAFQFDKSLVSIVMASHSV